MSAFSPFEYACRSAVLKTIDSMNEIEYPQRLVKAEYMFDRCCHGNGRPDIVIFREFETFKDTICIECKSCKRDLMSGYGLNFVGEINYIIFPEESDLTPSIINNYLSTKGECGVGILMFDKKWKIKCCKYAWRKREDIPVWLQMYGIGAGFGDY